MTTIEIVTDKNEALALVNRIGTDDVFTGYQNPVFLRAWLEQDEIEPLFIVMTAQGHGPVLLPLQRDGTASAHYLGGRHANGNFPVGKAEDIAALGNNAMAMLNGHHGLAALDIHTLMLERQHRQWKGVSNPFVDDSSVQSPNVALSLALSDDFDQVLKDIPGSKKRKKFRNHMRKLEAMGDVSVQIPVGDDEIANTLESFFAFKHARFAEAGIVDAFSDEATRRAWLSCFAATDSKGQKAHELFVLNVNGAPAAIMGNTILNGRLTVEFGTFNPEFGHAGPGDILFFLAVEHAVQRGIKIFDFGIGDEPYKRSWCDIETWHHDTFIAVSGRGQLHKVARTMRSAMIRRLKSNEQLWKTAKAARRKLVGNG